VYPRVRFPNLAHVIRCFAEPSLKKIIYSTYCSIIYRSAVLLQIAAVVINEELYGTTSNGFRYDAIYLFHPQTYFVRGRSIPVIHDLDKKV